MVKRQNIHNYPQYMLDELNNQFRYPVPREDERYDRRRGWLKKVYKEFPHPYESAKDRTKPYHQSYIDWYNLDNEIINTPSESPERDYLTDTSSDNTSMDDFYDDSDSMIHRSADEEDWDEPQQRQQEPNLSEESESSESSSDSDGDDMHIEISQFSDDENEQHFRTRPSKTIGRQHLSKNLTTQVKKTDSNVKKQSHPDIQISHQKNNKNEKGQKVIKKPGSFKLNCQVDKILCQEKNKDGNLYAIRWVQNNPNFIFEDFFVSEKDLRKNAPEKLSRFLLKSKSHK